jgi:hypothetical protein
MNKLAPALTATALLLLAACGGGAGNNQAAADNAVATAGETDNLTLPPDETTVDPAASGNTLGNQLNALETENALGNEATANSVANSASGAATNVTNTQ